MEFYKNYFRGLSTGLIAAFSMINISSQCYAKKIDSLTMIKNADQSIITLITKNDS